MHDWKSTAAAILSGLIGTFTSIMTLQVPAALLTPEQTHRWMWTVVICNAGAIIARVWVGIITKNADASQVASAINNAGTGAPPVTTADLTAPPK
jgi:hypothetical protein